MRTGENWRGVARTRRGQAEMWSHLSLIPWGALGRASQPQASFSAVPAVGRGLSADGRQECPGHVSGQGNSCEQLATLGRGHGRGPGASISRGRVSRIGALDVLHVGETVAGHCWKGKGESILLLENALGFLERAAEHGARTTGHYRRFG